MSTPVPCTQCGGPKSPKAVVCPRCGARDVAIDPVDHEVVLQKSAQDTTSKSTTSKSATSKPRLQLSASEAGALLGGEARPESPFATLFLPSPRLRGYWPLVDLVLIVLTIPLAIGLFLSLLRPRHELRRTLTYTGLVFENFLIALLGGGIVAAIGYQVELTRYTNPAVAVGVVALALRAWMRTWK